MASCGERGAEGERTGAVVVTEAGAIEREKWWNDAVFYQVFVRSFKDSEAGALAGDGIGDIAGLISKLDYLNDGDPATRTDLGVTGLWLCPINPSPSYHGYDVTDYTGVNRQFGTVEDVRRLVGECHKRGIRVIFDLVLNHCSSEHPWFVGAADPASAKHDWFIWSEKDPGWKGPWGQKVWHPATTGGKRSWYYGIFSSRMPDLNYRNAAVGEEMLRVVDFWIDPKGAIGADGYRLDAVRHLVEDGQVQENTPETHAWLRKFHAECRKVNPASVSIGEVWTASDVAASYVRGGDELDMAFEFDLAGAMVKAAREGTAATVVEAQAKVQAAYPAGQYGRFLTNHDQTRVMTQLKGDAGAMRSAAAMMLLGPGVPFIYYGEEIGMMGDKPDENLRRPMRWDSTASNAGFTTGKPWEGMGAEGRGVNVDAERGEEGSLWNWYRRLIEVRGAHPALAHGGYEAVGTGNPGVYAFVRTGDEPVLVVINLLGKSVSEYALEGAGSVLKGTWNEREVLHDTGAARGNATANKPVAELGAHEAYVFVMTKAKTGSK